MTVEVERNRKRRRRRVALQKLAAKELQASAWTLGTWWMDYAAQAILRGYDIRWKMR